MLPDVLRRDDSGIMVRHGEDQLIAQIEHQDIGITLVQGSQERGVGLCGQNNGRLGLTDNSSCTVIGKGRLGPGNDLLSLIGKEDQEIILFPLLGRFVEPAEGMEVVGELQDRINVEALALEFLRHREADDLTLINLPNREGWLVGTEDLGNLMIEKELQIGTQGSLHTPKLLRGLLKV
jgi:hypothetical protein